MITARGQILLLGAGLFGAGKLASAYVDNDNAKKINLEARELSDFGEELMEDAQKHTSRALGRSISRRSRIRHCLAQHVQLSPHSQDSPQILYSEDEKKSLVSAASFAVMLKRAVEAPILNKEGALIPASLDTANEIRQALPAYTTHNVIILGQEVLLTAS